MTIELSGDNNVWYRKHLAGDILFNGPILFVHFPQKKVES